MHAIMWPGMHACIRLPTHLEEVVVTIDEAPIRHPGQCIAGAIEHDGGPLQTVGLALGCDISTETGRGGQKGGKKDSGVPWHLKFDEIYGIKGHVCCIQPVLAGGRLEAFVCSETYIY